MKMTVNMLLGNIGTLGQVKIKGLVTFLAGYVIYFLLFLRGIQKVSILDRCLISFEGSSVNLWEQGRKYFSTLTMTVCSMVTYLFIYFIHRSGFTMFSWRCRLKFYKLSILHCLCYCRFFVNLLFLFFIFCHWDFLLQRLFILILDLLWTKSFISPCGGTCWLNTAFVKTNYVGYYYLFICLLIENDD